MGRVVPFNRWAIGIVCSSVLLAGGAYADEVDAHKQDDKDKKVEALLDCRYDRPDVGATSEAFPSDDVFRPLIADPKQPQFFAIWQHVNPRNGGVSYNLGSVAIGENFGFYTKRQGCNGWQIGLLTGIFAQFNLDTSNAALINTDFNVGIPISWRAGNWSARLRYYHQSSHLGDEFLISNLNNPGFKRWTLSIEEVDAILSYDYQWIRLYGGGGYLVHREPSFLDAGRIQWGFEARAPAMRTRILAPFLDRLVVTPVLSADFKSMDQHAWLIDTNVLGGFEWSRTGSRRRFRIMATYFYGHNPYGQFFIDQKIQSIGLGAYFMF
ncbi:MAG: DUF1207 domain-containing protein [Nitrospira sp.]|nr:DUF1207 domain-containing protein [Nitrospira sp.]